MTKINDIEKRLENHILGIEAQIAKFQEELDVAKEHQKKYLANKDVIEHILNLEEIDLSAPSTKKKGKKGD